VEDSADPELSTEVTESTEKEGLLSVRVKGSVVDADLWAASERARRSRSTIQNTLPNFAPEYLGCSGHEKVDADLRAALAR
jgi:hypothetical protein